MTDQPTPDADHPPIVDRHLWEIQPVRDVLIVVGVLALLWLGQTISIVTVPVLLAVLLAYLLEPIVRWLTAHTRLERTGAVATMIASLVCLVVVPAIVALTFGIAQLVGFVSAQVGHIGLLRDAVNEPPGEAAGLLRERLEEQAGPFYAWLADQFAKTDDASVQAAFDAISQWVQANAERVASTAADVGAGAAAATFGLLGSLFGISFMLFLTGFFFFFVSSSWPKVIAFGDSLVPVKHRERAHHLIERFDAVISAFIRGRLTIAFIQSIVFSAGYWLIGVPAPLILGPAVAFLSIVPYLALIGLPISITLLLLEGYTGLRGHIAFIMLAPTALYFLGQALDDYLWTPMIQGKSTDMSTPAILFASLAGGVLFGVFGLLIAIPIAACIKIALAEIVWPKYHEWVEGRRKDALPLGDR